jgi:hypothetical protein
MVNKNYTSHFDRAIRVGAVVALAQYCKRHYFEYATRELAVIYLPPAVTLPPREVFLHAIDGQSLAMGLRGRSYE